jgi:hypothetical protein
VRSKTLWRLSVAVFIRPGRYGVASASVVER